MQNNNGFEDALKQINTLLNVNQQVTLNVLEEAAKYFVDKLRKNIPRSKLKKEHMQNALKVVVLNDKVQVVFEDWVFYWRFVDRGTKKMRGRHFVRNTLDAESNRISEILTSKIIRKMEGK